MFVIVIILLILAFLGGIVFQTKKPDNQIGRVVARVGGRRGVLG